MWNATCALRVVAAPAAAATDEVVYERGGHLYALAIDGDVRQLTRGTATDRYPAWSPDRSRIAFVRDDSLHVMRADGTRVRRISEAVYDRYPAWSPDGRRIAFASNRGGGVNELYVARADGSHLRRLTRNERHCDDTQPTWTADGRSIVFASNRIDWWNYELFRVRASDGGGLTRLTRHGTRPQGGRADDVMPDISRDGRRVAFVSDRGGSTGVWTMAIDGSDLRLVYRAPGWLSLLPRFSPDGRRLLIQRVHQTSGDSRLLVTSVTGPGRPTILGRGTAPDW